MIDTLLSPLPGGRQFVNKQYDALGKVRDIPNAWEGVVLWLGRENKNDGGKSNFVLQQLADLQVTLDTSLAVPIRQPDAFGDQDIRIVQASNGKSIMDAWMKELDNLKLSGNVPNANGRTLTNELYAYLTTNNARQRGWGNHKADGEKAKTVRSIITRYRDAAWNVMLDKERRNPTFAKEYNDNKRLEQTASQPLNPSSTLKYVEELFGADIAQQ